MSLHETLLRVFQTDLWWSKSFVGMGGLVYSHTDAALVSGGMHPMLYTSPKVLVVSKLIILDGLDIKNQTRYLHCTCFYCTSGWFRQLKRSRNHDQTTIFFGG